MAGSAVASGIHVPAGGDSGRIIPGIEDGTISGGMIPKVKSCLEAIEGGVQNVHILDGRIEHCLLLEFFTSRGIGTLIRQDKEEV